MRSIRRVTVLLIAAAFLTTACARPKATTEPDPKGDQLTVTDAGRPTVTPEPDDTPPPPEGPKETPDVGDSPEPPEPTESRGGGDSEPRTTPTPPRTPGETRRFALLVGVEKYGGDLRDLRYTAADVKGLAEALLAAGYREEDVVVLTSSAETEPNAENVRAALTEICSRCGPDDLLLVALTGHGVQPDDEKQFFCPAGASLSDESTMIPMDEVSRTLAKSGAGMCLLLVDACRDTPGSRGRATSDGIYDTVTGSRTHGGVIAYYSCSKDERSWEPAELGNGLFCHILIEGLKGEADNPADGQISWTELVGYVERNINFYASRYGVKQTPHFKGDVAKPIALAVNADWRKKTERFPQKEVDWREQDVALWDFVDVNQGSLPKGWYGPAFARRDDEQNGRACVEPIRRHGQHWLELPPFDPPLTGDFVLEVEFALNGYQTNSYANKQVWEHSLQIHLEGRNGESVPAWVNSTGEVTFPGTNPRITNDFKPYRINRLRLIRQGDSYTVQLNDGYATGDRLPYSGPIENVRLGMIAGVPYTKAGADFPARLYSVKIAKLVADGDRPVEPGEVVGRSQKVIIDEDFTRLRTGGFLPEGWTGDGLSCLRDEKFDRSCLEVIKKEGVHSVSLPEQNPPIDTGWYLDLECLLNGHHGSYDDNKVPSHQLHVHLEGDGSPIHATLNSVGQLTISDGSRLGEELTPHQFERFRPLAINRLRLLRQGDSLLFVCNDGAAYRLPATGFGRLKQVRLGLTAGVPFTRQGEDFAARLHSVKLVALPELPVAEAEPFRGIHQTFHLTGDGLPEGWSARNGTVVRSHLPGYFKSYDWHNASPALTLNESSTGDVVELPAVELKENYVVGCEFQIPEPSRAELRGLTLMLAGEGNAGLGILITTKDDGKLAILGPKGFVPADVSKLLHADKPNTVRLIREGPLYAVTLNGTRVGTPFPANLAPGPFKAVRLALEREGTNRPSPRVTAVRVKTKE